MSHLSRPDHVVGGDRGADHLHQDVSISLFRITNAFQKRPVIKHTCKASKLLTIFFQVVYH